MTKIYFIGDTHFGKKYPFLKDYELNISKRNFDVIDNCEKIVNAAIEEKADYVIFLGDFYDRQIVSPTIRKIIRERIFIPLNKENIPTIIIGGNHDSIRNPKRGADILDLSSFPNVTVITEFKTRIIESNGIKTGLVILPYIHFDVLVEMAKKRGMEIPEEQNNYIIAQHIIKNYITQKCNTKLKNCDKRILIGHYYLEGAKIRETNNPAMIYGEFKFNRQMVQKDLFDLVIFGHVHLKQEVWKDNKIVIPGSIDRLDMGERDSDKFYCVYNIENDDLEFREIECRQLFKKEIDIPDDANDYTNYILGELPEKEKIKDAICRIIINYPKGKEVKIDKDQLEDYFSNSLHIDFQYVEKPGEEDPHLRELNLDPLSLFDNFIAQEYSDYKYYEDLRKIGIDILKREFSTIDLTTKGPLSINSISLQNFNNYGKGPNKISFDQDLYIIKGPTGSGKSSILDAVTFALFKRSTRRDAGLNIDEILYSGGYVDVEFKIGDKQLRVKRNTKKPKLELWFGGESLSKGMNITEIERKIENIIGYDYDSFISSFFIRQQELQIFSSLSSEKRQERLAKLFKLKIFQDTDKTLTSILKDLNKKKDTIKGGIKVYLEMVEALPEKEKELKDYNNELKGLKSQKTKMEKQIQDSHKKLVDLTPAYQEYEKIKTLTDQLEKTKEKEKQELEQSKKEQIEFNSLRDKLKEFDGLKKEKESLEIRRDLIEEKAREKEKIDSELSKNKELTSNIKKEYDRQLKDLMDEITNFNNRINDISAEITKEEAFQILRKNGRLSERLSRLKNVEIPMAKEYNDENRKKEFKVLEVKTTKELKTNAPKQKQITKDIFIRDELQEKMKELKQKYNKIVKEGRNRAKEYEKTIKELNDALLKKELIENFQKQGLELKQTLREIKEKENKKETIENQLKEIKDYSALLAKLEKDLVDMDKKLKDYRAKLKELEPTYYKYDFTYRKYERLKEDSATLGENIASKSTEIKKIKKDIEKIKEYQNKIKTSKKEINEIKKSIEIYTILRKNVFHLNGVPKFAIEKILPAISIRASQILSDLSDGRLNQIIFRPLEGKRVGFEIYIYDGEQERVADSFSGGEKTQINAAIRFSIMEQIAEIPDTAGTIFRKSNTLFIDEGDLGTLDDEVSRQRFVEKILELKNMFKKIILITHLEEVAEQFPNRIKIGRDPKTGKSKIF